MNLKKKLVRINDVVFRVWFQASVRHALFRWWWRTRAGVDCPVPAKLAPHWTAARTGPIRPSRSWPCSLASFSTTTLLTVCCATYETLFVLLLITTQTHRCPSSIYRTLISAFFSLLPCSSHQSRADQARWVSRLFFPFTRMIGLVRLSCSAERPENKPSGPFFHSMNLRSRWQSISSYPMD